MKTRNILKTLFSLLALAALFVPFKIFAAGASVKAAALFTFGSVDFNGEEERSIGKIVMAETFNHPAMNAFHTVVENIEAQKQVVYAGLLSKITKADAGCGSGITSKSSALTQKKWSPAQMKVWLQLCANELDGSLLLYARAKGTDVKNIIEGADGELLMFITENITQAMLEDAFRIMYFNKTTHTNVGAGSGSKEITAGVSLTDYTMINGFFKKFEDITAADTSRRVTISENAGADYATQDALGSTTARDVYKNLLTKSDYRVQGSPNRIIVSTMSLLNNYADWLESQAIPASYEMVQGGFQILKRRNVTIYGWDFLDRTIRADFDTTAKWLNPHRAFCTTPQNLQIGVDSITGMSNLEMWYSKDTEMNNFRAHYKGDCQVAVDSYIQYAY